MKCAIVTALLAAAVSGLASGAFGEQPEHPPEQASFGPSRTVPFELFRDQRIFFGGDVNGRATPVMLDSGAAITVIDSAFARDLHLDRGTPFQARGATGAMPGEIVSGVSVTVGSLHLSNARVLVMDLAPVAKAIGHDLPVVVGREAFAKSIVTVDFPNRRIAFDDPRKFSAPAQAMRAQLGESGYGTKTLKISIAGATPVDADLDLGNGSALVVSNAYWQSQPALSSLRHAAAQIGGVGGLKAARRVTVPRVTLGDRLFLHVPAVLNDDAQALPRKGANVGIDMLKPFAATFDFRNDALYLAGPHRIAHLPRERAGVRFELGDHRLKAVYVSPDGPAAAAGLRAGDELIAINGRKIAEDYYSRADWTFARAGDVFDLERADGTHVRLKLANYY